MTIEQRIFIAASVPRSIRQKRLSYIRLDDVIASVRRGDMYYDIIIFNPLTFDRARKYMAYVNQGMPSLEKSADQFVYIPQEVHKVVVPQDEQNPYGYALRYFKEIWKWDQELAA